MSLLSRMTRLQADLLLLFTAAIWGLAFVAQKSAMGSLGPLSFMGVRSALSVLVVLPLLAGERRAQTVRMTAGDWGLMAANALAFVGGVAFQQIGMVTASVTNAGFLTALYVVCTPLMGLVLFRHRQSFIVWPACLLAILGVWLLNGASLTRFSPGDELELLCAACFGLQINLVGMVMRRVPRPVLICLLQSGACAVVGLVLGLTVEHMTWAAISANLIALLYSGIISGGLGFLFQAVAQRHTPSSDAAIIMSGEALFAAIGGFLLLHERLSAISWIGCALIFAAILLVEVVPMLRRKDAA